MVRHFGSHGSSSEGWAAHLNYTIDKMMRNPTFTWLPTALFYDYKIDQGGINLYALILYYKCYISATP